MQLTALLLTACCLSVTAKTISQSITYSGKDVKLSTVFDVVRDQTGLFVLYNAEQVDDSKKITVDAKDLPLQDFLNKILANEKLSFSIDNTTILIKNVLPTTELSEGIGEPHFSTTATPPITGIIRDADGKPLSGVNIVVKGTKRGVTTDIGGNFSIEVGINETLVISSIGFNVKEIRVGNINARLTIDLERNVSPLDEVQIQAYGTTTRRLSTGNISTIKSDEIERQPINNPILALQGRVPGLTVTQTSGIPGARVKVQIRGLNSFSSNNPLFIVDGLPYANDIPALGGPIGGVFDASLSALNFINPSEIESINVLKDADATAIYGSRGANGVILITTKKGRPGATKVGVNMQSGWGRVTRKIKLLDKSQYIEMRQEAFKNDGVVFDPADPFKAFVAPDLFYWDTTKYTDWQKELIGGTAKYYDFQGSVSGGTTLTQYLIGGFYHKETTVFPGDASDQKAGIHFNINGNSANGRFTSSLSGSYLSNWTEFPREDFTKYITLAPTAPYPYREDGSLNWAPFLGFGFDEFQFGSFSNPYSNLFRPYKSEVNNLISSLTLKYKILSTFAASFFIGYNKLQGNSFVSLNPYSSISPGEILNGAIRQSNYNTNSIGSLITEPQLTYKNVIGNGTLSILLGSTFQNTNKAAQTIVGSGYSNDELMKNPGSASSIQIAKISSEYKYSAVYGRISYDWKQKYLLNLNARRDGSSRFGPGNQFGNFGSIAAAWIFNKNKFIQSTLPFLSYGKLRVSYGSAGNDGISDYAYFERYANTNGTYQGVRGLVSGGLFNNYYRWELTRKLELGFDVGFLSDHILLQTSLYQNRSSNQLINSVLPAISGPGSLVINLPATIQNRGLELVLNTNNVTTRKFSWTSSLNISFNQNKLVSFPGIEKTSYYTFSGYRVGNPMGEIPVFQSAGIDAETGRYQFYDKDGNLTFTPGSPQDKIKFINTTPRCYGGFSNSFTYGEVTLEALFQFVEQIGKNYLFSFNSMPGFLDGSLANQPFEVFNRWQKLGDISNVQKFSATNPDLIESYNYANQSDMAYSDASFVRLKNVSIAYSVRESLKNKLGVKNLSLYLLCQNLFTITNFKGLDPENQSTSSLPPLRILTFGMKVSL